MAKRETSQSARDNATQIGVLNGNVEYVQPAKGGLSFLSTGCIAASALVLVVSAVVLILSFSLGMSFLQNLTGRQQSPTSQPANFSAGNSFQGNAPSGSAPQGSAPALKVDPTSPPAAQPTQAVLAQSAAQPGGGIDGRWIWLFNDSAWGYAYYTLDLTRSGNDVSGTSRVTSADTPGCYEDYWVNGTVVDETAGIRIELREIYQPANCEINGLAAFARFLDLTYTNGPNGETLKGLVSSSYESSQSKRTVVFTRPR